jgi:hypothetical protein
MEVVHVLDIGFGDPGVFVNLGDNLVVEALLCGGVEDEVHIMGYSSAVALVSVPALMTLEQSVTSFSSPRRFPWPAGSRSKSESTHASPSSLIISTPSAAAACPRCRRRRSLPHADKWRDAVELAAVQPVGLGKLLPEERREEG